MRLASGVLKFGFIDLLCVCAFVQPGRGQELAQAALLPYVPQLMTKLAGKMLSPQQALAEQAVTAVAVIAGISQMHFVPYYEESQNFTCMRSLNR
eukprot:4140970-Amphidinium_carterae.1